MWMFKNGMFEYTVDCFVYEGGMFKRRVESGVGERLTGGTEREIRK